MPRGIEEVAVAFDRAVRAAEAQYVLIGAFAVGAWGLPRSTQDVDVLLLASEAVVPRLVRALREEGLRTTEDDVLAAIRERSRVTIFDPGSIYHVDAKIAADPGEKEQVLNAVELNLPSGRFRVARPEDVIPWKIKFGSPRDLEDARSVYDRQKGTLNVELMLVTAERIGVRPALEGQLRRWDRGPPAGPTHL